jgi:NAD(P)-dependent dehydrogenase (short-subunit alcohol dehydrogenase family)
MTRLFEDKVVVVTGAGRGLGRAHALMFASHGARVVVNDLGVSFAGEREADSPAQQVVTEILSAGGEAIADPNDISDWRGCEQLLENTLRAFGKVDSLILNAAIVRPRKLHELTEGDWDDQLRVNLGGTVLPVRIFSSYWVSEWAAGRSAEASIVCTTSKVGLHGTPFYLVYGCTKAAVAYFVEAAAAELAPYGIRVNGIAPRADTRMMQDASRNLVDVAGKEGIDALLRAVKSPPPWQASGPASVSPTVLWLASDRSKPTTGRILNVDGGRIALQAGWHDEAVASVPAEHTVDDVHRAIAPLLGTGVGNG